MEVRRHEPAAWGTLNHLLTSSDEKLILLKERWHIIIINSRTVNIHNIFTACQLVLYTHEHTSQVNIEGFSVSLLHPSSVLSLLSSALLFLSTYCRRGPGWDNVLREQTRLRGDEEFGMSWRVQWRGGELNCRCSQPHLNPRQRFDTEDDSGSCSYEC